MYCNETLDVLLLQVEGSLLQLVSGGGSSLGHSISNQKYLATLLIHLNRQCRHVNI
jgi:hypothetical protein